MPESRFDDALPVALPDTVRAALLAPMVDHHCHGVRRDEPSGPEFELFITEAGTPAPPGTTHFDTPVGAAIRRWCGPVLGLEPHVPSAAYLERRAELGGPEANARLLGGAGIAAFLVDTGLDAPGLLSQAEMGRLAGAATGEIVRLEQVEQEVVAAGPRAVDYLGAVREMMEARAAGAVGLKSIAAYRCGLDIDPARPSRESVIAAAERRLREPLKRLSDPVLVRHLLWAAADVARERGMPIQFHCGFGDTDLDLHRCDPSLLTGLIRALAPLGVPVILLHCYPYHRQAAYLASVFPHVYADVGLALTHTAAGSAPIVAELLELAPFHKVLFSSDCYGLAELCFLGALYHRRGLARVLADRLADAEWSAADAARIAQMIGSGNARRVYRL
jgi:predicted TIM-barrel fold metal-dependent hydrolase